MSKRKTKTKRKSKRKSGSHESSSSIQSEKEYKSEEDKGEHKKNPFYLQMEKKKTPNVSAKFIPFKDKLKHANAIAE